MPQLVSPQRRKLLKPNTNAHAMTAGLRARDLAVLADLQAFRTLTTVQVAMLHWPPSVAHMLAYWLKDRQRVAAWLTQYPEAQLFNCVTCLKFLLRVRRLRTKQRPSHSAEVKLHEWLASLQTDAETQTAHNELLTALDELDLLEKQMASDRPMQNTTNSKPSTARHKQRQFELAVGRQWLEKVVLSDKTLPEAFYLRPQHPHEFVSSACSARMTRLMDTQLIEPFEQASRRAEGSLQTCWYLTRKWRTEEARRLKVRARDIEWSPAGSYGIQLEHKLLLNDIRIAFEIACARSGYTLQRWLDDEDLKRQIGDERVHAVKRMKHPQTGEVVDDEVSLRLKIPDHFVWLKTDRGERHMFIELDNNTMSISSRKFENVIEQKYLTMKEFCRSGRIKTVYPEVGGGGIWYLTITTGSEERLRRLKSVAELIAGERDQNRYWFTRLDERFAPNWKHFFSNAVLSDAIWLRGGSEAWQTLAIE